MMQRYPRLLSAIGVILLFAGASDAGVGDQIAKLIADDAVTNDFFGLAVGISGNTAIAGSNLDDDNGALSGSAYLFDAVTGAQMLKLLPSDGASQDQFGFSVAISGGTALVGSKLDDDNGTNSGSAYLFDTTSGAQLFKLLASDGANADEFGFSSAMDGTTAIVGAPFNNDMGSDSGSAYLFDTTTGSQLHKLLPSDGALGHEFGYSVAISGTTAIVGAHAETSSGVNSGAVYVFDTTTGLQVNKLVPADNQAGDHFGFSVAISGTTALIGAYLDGDNGQGAGSAYIFDTVTGQQLHKLLATGGLTRDFFGTSVAIEGDVVMVGAEGTDDNGTLSGSVYFFDAVTGLEALKLVPIDNAIGDCFGGAVAISGSTAIIGARKTDDVCVNDPTCNSGAAYLVHSGVAAPCPGDINTDGVIDTADLGILLGQFGTAGPGADINGDGVVDTADLGILLGVFGTVCP